MATMKKDLLFNFIVLFLIIVLLFILYAMVSTKGLSDAQNISTITDQSFNNTPELCNSTLTLEIIGMNNVSWNYSTYYYNNYPVLVVDSGDPNIKNGFNFTMEIDEIMKGYYGITTGISPKELVGGSIIQVASHNDPQPGVYYFDGKTIKVYVEADPYNQTEWDNAWKQKITISN